jgi:AcrR family transcriptional regulator
MVRQRIMWARMTETPTNQYDAARAPRRARIDAQRNEDGVLQAAKDVFVTDGVDAPVRKIAVRAGVGVATVYRRFPSRADLVVAVFCREVDDCAAAAAMLESSETPLNALRLWLFCYADFVRAKSGLAAALRSGDPAFAALPGYFRANFEPALPRLLNLAAQASVVRDDVEAYDVLHAIGNLSIATGDDGAGHTSRILGLLINGLIGDCGKIESGRLS